MACIVSRRQTFTVIESHLRDSDNRERGTGGSRRAVPPDMTYTSRDLAAHANHAQMQNKSIGQYPRSVIKTK